MAAAGPLLVGGAVVLALAWAARRHTRFGAWARALFASRAPLLRDSLRDYAVGRRPFSSLREAIVGSAKGAVVRVFGPPRTAMLGRGMRTMSIWRADTWYYPLDQARKSVLAIRFEGNVARDVEQIGVPGAVAD